MITVISSTNRIESMTDVVSQVYYQLLLDKKAEVQLLSMKQLPEDFLYENMYKSPRSAQNELVDKYIDKSDKFVFVIPEYNGSYPGILKLFLDTVPPKFFRDKKAGIIGVSDGHAGNLRGQEHLTSVLQHLKMFVHYSQPKLSNIDDLVDANKVLTDERALRLLGEHADKMMSF